MKFKYAIRGISRRFFYSFLIIAQLIFGFYSMYENINLYKRINSETDKVEKFFKDKRAYALEVSNLINNGSDLQKIIDAFKNMENSSKYTFIKTSMVGPMAPVFDNYQQFQDIGNFKSNINGKTYFQIKDISINKPYLKTYPLKVEKGRLFTSNEFNFSGNNDVFPIVVGSNYGKHFKIGDEIPLDSHIGKIIGILKENQYAPGDVRQPDVRYINLDNYIISTDASYKDKFDLCNLTLYNANYILFDSSANQSEIYNELAKIKKIFNDIPAIKDAGVRDLTQYITQDADMLKEQYEIIAVTSMSVIIFVCITFIVSILDSIEKRKKEYGIHIMSGGKLSDIAGIVYLEIFITFFIAYIITASIIYYRDGGLININSLLVLLLVMIIVSGISALIPVIRIFKLNVSNLVKGDE
ncbi:MAG: ABC transporter permease [Clostridium tyrobutyricum]|jgi:putative ABC transport system permease protein|uniref:FtsX-like permease family protein n=1 Tax=Clostridium tyrobutyricum TaxID=1519 RepID=UPI00057F3E73|nr:FtsX-like permease family protein [Clostridium tyrobutyricum]MBV4421732.1 ABC transporter permease [Clostridium tyrobutyricum]MBV4437627.1 ABC transporter permease [Clostridium tyrobutyricum]MBV4446128.1 ABC transporter permease [Clostridium tyrobutyricum]MCH4199828.1 ABC transporter permease [Clostridium tyrobutyricum]MCH4237660.1 ABC transporter permease [Clostridium tyrobutyricum]